MKRCSAVLTVVWALLLAGCGGEDASNEGDAKAAELDLDDLETRKKIIAEAIDFGELEFRSEKAPEVPLLIPCKACKKNISQSGAACANCSHPNADSLAAYESGITLSDEKLAYAPNQQKPYTGWVNFSWDDGQGLSMFKNGKRHGLAKSWWHNGQKAFYGVFKEEKLMTAVAWKPNGEKCPHTNVVNGNGVTVYYNEDGTEEFRETYKDGEVVEE